MQLFSMKSQILIHTSTLLHLQSNLILHLLVLRIADALDALDFLGCLEGAVLRAVLDDALRRHSPYTGQLVELLFVRRVDVHHAVGQGLCRPRRCAVRRCARQRRRRLLRHRDLHAVLELLREVHAARIRRRQEAAAGVDRILRACALGELHDARVVDRASDVDDDLTPLHLLHGCRARVQLDRFLLPAVPRIERPTRREGDDSEENEHRLLEHRHGAQASPGKQNIFIRFNRTFPYMEYSMNYPFLLPFA